MENGIRLAERGSAWLRAGGGLDEALRRFGWFYCGAEFCENLLPTPGWYAREAEFFLGRGAAVCLLTPPVSEKGLKVLRPVFRGLARLARAAAGRIEVTVNDLGALQLARETAPELALNAGRLIYDNVLLADRRKLKVLNGEAVRLFASLGVDRFEISTTGRQQETNFGDAKAYGFRPSDIALTLHYPYLNLTSGRSCVTGMPDIGPEDSPAGVACRRECAACAFELSHPSINEPLTVRGNTVFLKFPAKFYRNADTLRRRRIDRLVYSPFP